MPERCVTSSLHHSFEEDKGHPRNSLGRAEVTITPDKTRENMATTTMQERVSLTEGKKLSITL